MVGRDEEKTRNSWENSKGMDNSIGKETQAPNKGRFHTQPCKEVQSKAVAPCLPLGFKSPRLKIRKTNK